MLSKRVQSLSESLTIAISTIAREMKARGEDILSFSAGEPDFDTPKIIKNAAIDAIEKGCGKYTAVPGSAELLAAVCEKLQRDNNLSYTPKNIITNVGAKHSLFNLFQAILNEGDEVIIPAPYWVTYPEIVKLCGATPVILETDEKSGFKITKKQLQNAITPKTKLLVLNSPSNPTGAIYLKKDLEELAEVLKPTKILVASDEIYEKLSFAEGFISTAAISEDMFERTITINGLSKSSAMPGWRFGYLASANLELVSAINRLQSQSTSNITSIVQEAAIPALLGRIETQMQEMKEVFKQRRDIAVELINEIPNISVLKPDGAFYLFINVSKVEADSMKFARLLLEKKKVAVVPGIGFGSDGYVRFSFATDLETIKKGIERLSEFVLEYDGLKG